jgi:hypothetical protein
LGTRIVVRAPTAAAWPPPAGAALMRITASCASIAAPKLAPRRLPEEPTTAQLAYSHRAGCEVLRW